MVFLLCASLVMMNLLVTVTAAPGGEVDSIQFQASARQFSLRVPMSPPTIVTFPPLVTVGEVLGARAMLAFVKQSKCQFVRECGKAVPMSAILAQECESASVARLTCESGLSVPVERVSTWRDRVTAAQRQAIAEEGELRRLLQLSGLHQARDYPFYPIEYLYNTVEALYNWVVTFVKDHWGPLRPFPTYTPSTNGGHTGLYHLNTGRTLTSEQSIALTQDKNNKMAAGDDEEVRFSLTSDWASGTWESQVVSDLMVSETKPHYTIHIGDVYYVGSHEETLSNCLGEAPPNVKHGVKFREGTIGTFAFEGNHEMYSRGYGYFDTWLPRIGMKDPKTGAPMGQKASFASLDNKYWRVIGLDTGYNTYSWLIDSKNNTQPGAVMDWLVNVVKIGNPSDTRGIILLSHHQYYSAFEQGFFPTPEQLSQHIPANRTVLWLWGHEHKVSWYDKGSAGGVKLNAYGRCIGVGGFPVDHEPVPAEARSAGLVAYDNRVYRVEAGVLGNVTTGLNGFTTMRLNGRNATLEYRSLALNKTTGMINPAYSTLLVRETFVVDNAGSVRLADFKVVDPEVTVVQHEQQELGDVNDGLSLLDKQAAVKNAKDAQEAAELQARGVIPDNIEEIIRAKFGKH